MANANNPSGLREAIRKLNPHQAEDIRQAYYKAIEGLASLDAALSAADALRAETCAELLTERMIAVKALVCLRTSQLGKIV